MTPSNMIKPNVKSVVTYKEEKKKELLMFE